MVTLDDHERDKFAQWLEQDADSNEGLIEQLKKLLPHAVLVKRKQAEIHACRIVARMLRNTETQTIGGD